MSGAHTPPELPEDRDGFRFRGGSPVLDLTATLQARRTATPRELLQIPGDLDRWLISAGVAAEPPRATSRDLGAARELREAIFDIAGSVGEASLDVKACSALNRIAAGAAAVPVLATDASMVLRGSAHALLVSLARQAVHLFASEARRIRQCGGPGCSIYFIDASRAGERRWCSMAACGNKSKVAALRRRQRTVDSAE
jgi:predicted RNA-binding Zn ribbon-like protein